MKKIVLRYGLSGGIIVGVILAASTIYGKNTGHTEGSMVLGFASMILAFSMIFVALKQLRDKQYGGFITFGKAFQAALLITLITSSVYVLVWAVCYHFFIPDFIEQYTASILNKAQAEGINATEMAKKKIEMQQYATMYKNPLFFVLITYSEILPVGLIVSFIAALILKRKAGNSNTQEGKFYAAENV